MQGTFCPHSLPRVKRLWNCNHCPRWWLNWPSRKFVDKNRVRGVTLFEALLVHAQIPNIIKRLKKHTHKTITPIALVYLSRGLTNVKPSRKSAVFTCLYFNWSPPIRDTELSTDGYCWLHSGDTYVNTFFVFFLQFSLFWFGMEKMTWKCKQKQNQVSAKNKQMKIFICLHSKI